MLDLVAASEAALIKAEEEKEAQRQRELAQAQALAALREEFTRLPEAPDTDALRAAIVPSRKAGDLDARYRELGHTLETHKL